MCSSQMLFGNHQYWLCGVSSTQPSLVPITFLVLSGDFKLFFLWGVIDRLFWCSHQPDRSVAFLNSVPQVHFVHHVCHGIRLVCALLGQEILHETIFPLCLDSRSFIDCGHTILPNYSGVFVYFLS